MLTISKKYHEQTYELLVELELYFSKKLPHGELHTKIYDLLNDIDKED